MQREEYLLVGKVSRLHGYKGGLSLKLDHSLPFEFDRLESIFIERQGKLVPYFIQQMNITPKGFAITSFEGVGSEEQAKKLIGSPIYLLRDALPEEASDMILDSELIGYHVSDVEAGDVGEVIEVIDHPGNKLLVIEKEEGEALIPFIDEFIKELDHDERRILTEVPEGLFDINTDEDAE